MTQSQLLNRAHRKIGIARKILDDFWCRPDASNPRNIDTSVAMHVAIVQLTEALKKGST